MPKITLLQFSVLSALIDGEASGRAIRDLLAKEGHRKGLAAFYQLMSRLEEEKLVRGFYETRVVAGRPLRERMYRITGEGLLAVDEVRAFVAATSQRKLQLGW